MLRLSTIAALLLTCSPIFAQPLRLEERFVPDAAYHVSCRVQIAGKMTLPDKVLEVEGKSHVEYDERVVHVADGNVVDKTVRLFSSMEFERKIGGDIQKSSLRPAVHRLVVLRQNNIEAPFSPDGLLKLGEIDLIRTDVFTPALTGMLPKNAVSPGDTWKADESATRELTDLGQITAGELTCRFERIDRSLAKVSFAGNVKGVGENGPTRHELDGFYYFDTAARLVTYVSIKGTEHLTDDKGKATGSVTGTFVLTREPRAAPAAIANLGGAQLIPDEDNTRILFEDEDLGVRIAHSRKWKPRIDGTQLKLEDLRGNGVVVTLDPLNRLPTIDQFTKDTRADFERRKATVTNVSTPQALQRQPTSVERATVDATVASDKSIVRVNVVLAVVRDDTAGATFAATLVTNDRAALAREVEKMAASLRVAKGK